MVYMCIAIAAVSWYSIYIVLQIDQYRYFIIVFKQISYITSKMPGTCQIVDVINIHVAALPSPVTVI